MTTERAHELLDIARMGCDSVAALDRVELRRAQMVAGLLTPTEAVDLA